MNPLKAHYVLGEGRYQGDINGLIPLCHKDLLGHGHDMVLFFAP